MNDQPGGAGAAHGSADMGRWRGGQAELPRVPWGYFSCLSLPEDARERHDGCVMLSEISPSACHAVEMSGLTPGESIVIYGAGPAGQRTALSARIKGVAKVLLVDRHPDRLRLAEGIDAIPVDDSRGSAVEQVLERTGGLGAHRGCECVGYQAHDPQRHEDDSVTLNNLVAPVRFTGGIGTIGVFVP